MAGRYIVRKFKNGVKHIWDTEVGSCIHHSKVKERIPKKEFDILYKEFMSKQPKKVATKKVDTSEQLPKLSDILSEVISVYSEKTSIEEIIGALEMCKTRVLALDKIKR